MIFDNGTFISALSWTLIHSLWQGLLLAAVCAMVLILSRNTSARLRYNVLCSLLCLFILATVITFFWQINAMPDDTLTAHASTQAEKGTDAFLRHISLVSLIENTISYINRNVFWIATIWFGLFCLKSFGIFRQFGQLQKLKKFRTITVSQEWANTFIILKEKLDIKKAVTFLESHLVTVPCVVGFISPVVLVPVGLLTSLPSDQVEAMLLHELAHIKRRDFVMNLVQTFTETLFFFNPALIWVNLLIREERENCCDDIAVSVSHDRPSLVRALLSIGHGASAHNLSPAFSGRKNSVLRRAQRILGVKNTMINQLEKSILSVSILCFALMIFACTYDPVQKVEMIAQMEDLPKDFKAFDRQLQNDMISQGIINDTTGMSYKLSKEDFIVNGKLQPSEVHNRFKAKYMKYKNMTATFYNWKFEE